jgi:hypothetical protein
MRTERLRAAASGGRWLVWAGRLLLWTTLVVVGVTGLRTLLLGSPAGDGVAVAPDPAAAFPVQAGMASAALFATDYLTWEPSQRAARALRMSAALGDAARGSEVSGEAEQAVEQVVPVGIEVGDPGVAVATIAVRVLRIDAEETAREWLHVAVPLVADPEGAVRVTGAPVLVPAPPEAGVDVTHPPAGTDSAAAQELAEPLAAFFRAYAEGDATEVRYLVTDDSAVGGGLDGQVAFERLERVTVAAGRGPERVATATVRWRTGSATVAQSYRVTVRRVGDRWYVADVGVPLPSPTRPGTEPDVGTPAATWSDRPDERKE